MSTPAGAYSTLPAELLATDTHNALARHIFPPYFPTLVQAKLKRAQESKPPPTTSPPLSGIAAEGGQPWDLHPSPPKSTLSGAPTESTHKLFELFGGFNFVRDSAPPGKLVQEVLRGAQRPPTSPARLLSQWNDQLDFAELQVWRLAYTSVSMIPEIEVRVPNYHQRYLGELGGRDGIAAVRLAHRPTHKRELTWAFTSFLAPLLAIIFRPGSGILKEEVGASLVTKIFREPRDHGAGTADVAMRKPVEMSEDEWSHYLNFIAEIKLLPSDDLESLVSAAKRLNTRGGETSTESSQESQQGHTYGSPKTGFTLTLTDGKFEANADNLPPVFDRILPLLVEQMSVHHAHMMLFGNYDAFVLLKLLNSHTASISDVFYRDPNMHPNVDVHPPGTPANPILLEMILSGMLSTRRAADKRLWRDMAKVRASVVADEPARTTAKERKKESDKTRNSSTSAAAATATSQQATICAILAPSPSWGVGMYAQHTALLPDGEERWPMVEPESVDEILCSLDSLRRDSVHGIDQETPAPPIASTSTSSTPSSSPHPSTERPRAETIHLTIDEYLGSGRLYDAYAGKARVAGVEAAAALKYVNLLTFQYEDDCGRSYRNSVYNEVDLLESAASVAPGIAPRFIGLFTRGEYQSQLLLVTEDCGDEIDVTEDAAADAIRSAYRSLHAGGLIHNDVEERHVLRDRAGNIRIVDWEDGRIGSPDECAAEMRHVERMIARARRRKELEREQQQCS